MSAPAFPRTGAHGRYESYYLRAVDPASPREQTIAWVYADPPGGEHHSANCSIAALEVELGGRRLATAHGGVYELGMREHDHRLRVASLPDP